MDKDKVIGMLDFIKQFSDAMYDYIENGDNEDIEETFEFIKQAVNTIQKEIYKNCELEENKLLNEIEES